MHHKKNSCYTYTSYAGLAEESKTTMCMGLFYNGGAKIYDTLMTSISTIIIFHNICKSTSQKQCCFGFH